MSADAAARSTANPYVGPQSVPRGTRLYGRDLEAADLLDFFIAKRIVLLHSPSGAGKTSLIQARLEEQLEQAGFEILPPVRVVHTQVPSTARNRYVLSTLLSLEEDVPYEARTVDELADLTIREYLDTRPDVDGIPENEVLIFDQFEEILTSDPTDQEAKKEFFRQLGEALAARRVWALFAIREDFLAQLDPYVRYIPTRFAARYRLNLPTFEQARAAIVEPASAHGVTFEAAAAERLVDDLRAVSVQRPDGVTKERGPYVEPVQLQVVCRQVWEKSARANNIITVADVVDVGDVDQALASYYAEQMARIAAETGLSERSLREWLERDLITNAFRTQVLRGPGADTAMQKAVLEALTTAHLIRAEDRRGATWYELAHDRLIDPVIKNNATWRAQNLSDFEQRAAQWDESDRPPRLLLHSGELAQVRAWIDERGLPLEETEEQYLDASTAARDAAERELRTHKRTRLLAVAALIGCVLSLVALVVAVFSTVSAIRERDRAETNERAAERSGVVGLGFTQLNRETDLSLLLGQAALSRPSAQTSADENALNLLQLAVDSTPVQQTLRGHALPAVSVAWSPDGARIATGDATGTIRLWSGETSSKIRTLDTRRAGDAPEGQAVQALAFSPDGSRLAAGRTDGWVVIIDVDDPRSRVDFRAARVRRVLSVAFSPDGTAVAAATAAGAVVVGDAQSGAITCRIDVIAAEPEAAARTGGTSTAPPIGTPVALTVNDVAWTPDGTQLAAVDGEGQFTLWDGATGDLLHIGTHSVTGGSASTVDISPDGTLAVTGGNDGDAVIWDLATRTETARVSRPPGLAVRAASFAVEADGRLVLALVDNAGNALVIDPATGAERLTVTADGLKPLDIVIDPVDSGRAVVTTRAGDPAVWSIAVAQSPPLTDLEVAGDGSVLTASDDGTVVLSAPDQPPVTVARHAEPVVDTAMSADHSVIVSTALPADLLLHRPGALPDERTVALHGVDGVIVSVAVDGEGRYVAVGYADGLVTLWNAQTGEELWELGRTGRAVVGLDFATSDQLVAVYEDGSATLWGPSDEGLPTEHLADLALHGTPTAVDWSPAGDRLAIALDDNNDIQVWAVGTVASDAAQLYPPLTDHTHEVNDVAFDPTGQFLVSAGNDRTVVIWDATTGDRVRRVMHGSEATHAQFTPDGGAILVTSDRGTPYVVWTDPEDVVAEARRRTTRPLTAAECNRYLGPSYPVCVAVLSDATTASPSPTAPSQPSAPSTTSTGPTAATSTTG